MALVPCSQPHQLPLSLAFRATCLGRPVSREVDPANKACFGRADPVSQARRASNRTGFSRLLRFPFHATDDTLARNFELAQWVAILLESISMEGTEPASFGLPGAITHAAEFDHPWRWRPRRTLGRKPAVVQIAQVLPCRSRAASLNLANRVLAARRCCRSGVAATHPPCVVHSTPATPCGPRVAPDHIASWLCGVGVEPLL